MNSLFSISYFGSVSYWSFLLAADNILLEQHCRFERQSYRNRCNILGANGVLPLSVPVLKPVGGYPSTREAEISYDVDWRQSHWRSIVSAYNNSPFFEFYADEYEAIFQKKYKFLWDLNMAVFDVVENQLDVNIAYSLTSKYHQPAIDDADYREIIHPKRIMGINDGFNPVPYRQIFGEKYGFVPDLSIIDLIFNKGPESVILLRQCSLL